MSRSCRCLRGCRGTATGSRLPANVTGRLLVPVGEVLEKASFGALALLVGGVQAHAEVVGGVRHADVVEAGDGE
jgi:hypothetical protein